MTIQKLVEKFNKWADERILDLQHTPLISDSHQRCILARIDTLNWAKKNLERLAKEKK